MPEIQAHPLGRIAPQVVVYSQGALGGARLQLIRQRIVVAGIVVMQKAPYGAEKLDGVARQFIFIHRAESWVAAVACQLAHPQRGMEIAQAAWRFLDIRLQMKNRVAVASKSFAGQTL